MDGLAADLKLALSKVKDGVFGIVHKSISLDNNDKCGRFSFEMAQKAKQYFDCIGY